MTAKQEDPTQNRLDMIYKINVQTPTKTLYQFDNFTLVHFTDNSWFVAIKPKIFTQTTAKYAQSMTGLQDNFLKL